MPFCLTASEPVLIGLLFPLASGKGKATGLLNPISGDTDESPLPIPVRRACSIATFMA